MISRDMVTARIQALQKQREDLRLTMIACDGAIQDCEHWLSVLDTAPKSIDELSKMLGADSISVVDGPAE